MVRRMPRLVARCVGAKTPVAGAVVTLVGDSVPDERGRGHRPRGGRVGCAFGQAAAGDGARTHRAGRRPRERGRRSASLRRRRRTAGVGTAGARRSRRSRGCRPVRRCESEAGPGRARRGESEAGPGRAGRGESEARRRRTVEVGGHYGREAGPTEPRMGAGGRAGRSGPARAQDAGVVGVAATGSGPGADGETEAVSVGEAGTARGRVLLLFTAASRNAWRAALSLGCHHSHCPAL